MRGKNKNVLKAIPWEMKTLGMKSHNWVPVFPNPHSRVGGQQGALVPNAQSTVLVWQAGGYEAPRSHTQLKL